MWKSLLYGGITLLGVGELPLAGDWGMILQFGALGILAVAVVLLFRELSEQRKAAKSERDAHAKTLDRLCDRWNGWEQTRHDDHEVLTETLTGLRIHCGQVRADNK